MTKIELKTDELKSLLDLSGLAGDLENKEILLAITPTAIRTSAAKFEDQSVDRVISGLVGTVKGTFEDVGEVGINDLAIVRKFLSGLSSDKLTLKKHENKLVFESAKTRFSETLRNPKYLTNLLPEDKFKSSVDKAKGNEFILKKEDIKKILQSYKTFSSCNIQIAGKDKTLIIQLSNDSNELTLNFDLENSVQLFKVHFLNIFMQLLSQLSAYDITFSIKENCPVYVKVEKSNLMIEYLLAPVKK